MFRFIYQFFSFKNGLIFNWGKIILEELKHYGKFCLGSLLHNLYLIPLILLFFLSHMRCLNLKAFLDSFQQFFPLIQDQVIMMKDQQYIKLAPCWQQNFQLIFKFYQKTGNRVEVNTHKKNSKFFFNNFGWLEFVIDWIRKRNARFLRTLFYISLSIDWQFMFMEIHKFHKYH